MRLRAELRENLRADVAEFGVEGRGLSNDPTLALTRPHAFSHHGRVEKRGRVREASLDAAPGDLGFRSQARVEDASDGVSPVIPRPLE